ncbi:MAG TPA: FlgD immunoglobulin-like domain containing protein [Candidatus Eisenbacteria bacterium]|nr:FlgD immunoglobulin-like domain containing protein [Candidatus Eisenbacteria bacterium]
MESPVTPRPSLRLALVAVMAIAACGMRPAAAQEPVQRTPELEARIRAVKEVERMQLMEGTARVREARHEAAGRRALAKRARHGRKSRGRANAGGAGIRKVTDPEMLPPTDLNATPRRATPATAANIATVPANVRCNNPALQGDAGNAGQSEQQICSLGSDVIVAWNDGQGFNVGGDTQGYAFSADGGATFTDGGDILHPSGFPAWRWTSDPVVAVNEKTGRFYYCGLANSDASHNAIGVAIGHFTGTSFAWDTSFVVRNVSNATQFLDKEWLAVDSLDNSAVVTNTTFDVSGDHIDYYRSTTGGRTWSAATQLSDPTENGRVQGSRPAFGPAGEVYVVWQSLGPNDPDFYFVRKSTNGTTFNARVQAVQYLANFGTGAPGFNRNRGITFPSIAVDRTPGPNRGRVYLAWNESLDWFQFITTGSPIAEPTETSANNFALNATPFTPGNTVHGVLNTSGDRDYFKFNLTAGQSMVAWVDSTRDSTAYTLRVFAPSPDSTQFLCFTGQTSPATNSNGATQSGFMFTAPVTATYFLRVASAGGAGTIYPGGYRVLTNFVVNTGERSRDQRDVFVTHSDDGSTWSTPTRVNDDNPGFDEFLGEIAVSPDGCPYASWFDFRDDTFGSRNFQYMSRSNDGGGTWTPNVNFATVQSNFTTCPSNIAPNQGDYSAIAADGRFIHTAWADGRGSSVDVFSATLDASHQLTACPPNQNVIHNSSVPLEWTLANDNALFGNVLSWSLTSQRNWPMPPGSIFPLAAGASGPLDLSVAIPDTAANGVNTLTLTVVGQRNLMPVTCQVQLTVNNALAGVGDQGALEFALAAPAPNPAHGATTLQFSLPRPGAVTLAVYGLRGERVATLVSGALDAGRHVVAWDGRDARGHLTASGTYFVRLEGLGRSAVRRIVWMN